MTDYNDCEWHTWNGGVCPVHPDSEVEVRLCDPRAEHGVMVDRAGAWDWHYRNSSAIVSFRVTKPYVEPKKPREWWLHYEQAYEKQISVYDIHVREVLE